MRGKILKRYGPSKSIGHVLGNDPAQDELIYEEPDETFSGLRGEIQVKAVSHDWVTPNGVQRILVLKCRYAWRDVSRSSTRESGGMNMMWIILEIISLIRTNDQAKNFRLMKTEVNATHKTQWQEVISHREDVFFEGFEFIP